jgi:hypothetical protein
MDPVIPSTLVLDSSYSGIAEQALPSARIHAAKALSCRFRPAEPSRPAKASGLIA